jgi:hypothetical protein
MHVFSNFGRYMSVHLAKYVLVVSVQLQVHHSVGAELDVKGLMFSLKFPVC